MLKLQDYWRERSAKQKGILAAAFLLTFAAIAGLSWFASRPGMALLYSGLNSQQSGAILAAVEKSGIAYRIEGDSIWVDESRRDALRMSLAGEGLPDAGGAGYEILDGMSGFGTTSQMFDAAYWRAKEGELARTILALPNVRTARVHLAVPSGRGYRREAQATASVTVTTNGTALDRSQAKALKFLVSSGVPGMDADRVSVIDSERGVVTSGEEFASEDRETEMKRNVERILEAHVGMGNAIVELNLDVVNETERMTEQRFDPQQRALIAQENEESTDQSSNAQEGAVTAASNLPEGQGQGGGENKSSRSETRQRSNFEVSNVTREVSRRPGATRRLTVAVLVNGVAQTGADNQTTLVPREESELQAIRELVASAVGFDETRGDAITIKSLPFASLSEAGTAASEGGLLSRLDLNGMIRIILVGLFALALAMFLLRPILKAKPVQGGQAFALDTSAPVPAIRAPETPRTAAEALSGLPAVSAAVPEIDFTPATIASADPVDRLKELMKARKEESLKVLSGWIEKREDAV
ncbi:flagellar basal-body MS-ring/collar protein FliF [Paracoccus lutimaris]|uniref:Flagellar M-ring protein n=1 Tax=Paracoccus lutimaris TaxID=1490030 RepID=A0A368YRN9_9RHOB|nr:flagellar basal-body MS-ring/collar protein FliF [Paracoccus lutimaris]RCW82863.1 flagellar M-ring protein FliF [Paracoccus lutimaris]